MELTPRPTLAAIGDLPERLPFFAQAYRKIHVAFTIVHRNAERKACLRLITGRPSR